MKNDNSCIDACISSLDKFASRIVCRNINCGKKHHTLLYDSFHRKAGSMKTNVKAVQLQRTGQVAVVPAQLKNCEKNINTYASLGKSSCQSLLLKPVTSELYHDVEIIRKPPFS